MSQMWQEKCENNNLRFEAKLQMSHCLPRLRHTLAKANSPWWLTPDISVDVQCLGRKGRGWRNLFVCGAQVGSDVSESLETSMRALTQWILERRELLLSQRNPNCQWLQSHTIKGQWQTQTVLCGIKSTWHCLPHNHLYCWAEHQEPERNELKMRWKGCWTLKALPPF